MRRPPGAWASASVAALALALALVRAPSARAFGPAVPRAAAPGWHGRFVAGIEMLTASPRFVPDALANLALLHASTVYLYVAYAGQAFFPLPPSAEHLGLRTTADALPSALAAFRKAGYRVVLVISTSLLERAGASPAAQALLQPGSNVIDPVTAAPLVSALVHTVAGYRPNAIYVGEPFDWAGYTPPPGAWLAFYRRVAAAARKVTLVMLLATMHNEYGSVANAYGAPLDTGLARSGMFSALGIDAEGMVPRSGVNAVVSARWANTAPAAFAQACVRLGGNHALDEIPVTNSYDLTRPAPIAIVARAVAAANTARVQGIVVFADEYLGNYPPSQRRRISRLLAGFLLGPGA